MLFTAARNAKTLPQILEINKLDEQNPNSAHRLGSTIAQKDWPFEEKISALEDNLSQKDFKTQLGTIFNDLRDSEEVLPWIHQQTDDKLRDHSLSTFSHSLSRFGRHSKAYEVAEEIQEADSRENALLQVSRLWHEQNPTAAQEKIAPEILEKIR